MRKITRDDSIGSSSANTTLMRSTMLPINSWARIDIFVLLLIFVLFYFFKLSEFSLSIDDEQLALSTSREVWISTGRWANYLCFQFLLPQSTIPFLPIFLFGLFLSISYPIILSAFGVNRLNLIHYLAFPLYAALPTWLFLAAFAANIATTGIAQLLVVCAVYRYRHAVDNTKGLVLPKKQLALDVLLSALPLAVAIGIYQSFAISFILLSVAVLLTLLLRETLQWRVLLQHIALLIGILLIAGALYEIIDIAFRSAFNLHDGSYIGNFANWRPLIESPLSVAKNVMAEMLGVYGGQATVYGVAAFGFPLIIVLGLLAIAFMPKLSVLQRWVSLIFAASILMLPFLQNFLAGGYMPPRTLVSVPAVFWVFAMIAMTSRRYWLASVAFFSTVVSLLQILYSSNLLQSANKFARIHDQELAAAIYSRIVDVHPDFSFDKAYKVDFFGAKHFDTIYPRPPSSTSGFSFFEWDGGNLNRIVSYMHLIGYANLQNADQAQRQGDLAIFQQMQTWPAKDSVRVVGEVTLVKLGFAPGYPFNGQ